MKKRLKVWTRKQKWHIRTATFQFWRKSFTISWTFRMMLSKHTFCEHEQCSLIKLAFQLVCWDNLGLMVLRGGGALCIWYPQCSVCCDGQRQATLLALTWLLCWQNWIATQLSLPILVVMEPPAFYQKELLRLATEQQLRVEIRWGLLLATSLSQVCCG